MNNVPHNNECIFFQLFENYYNLNFNFVLNYNKIKISDKVINGRLQTFK